MLTYSSVVLACLILSSELGIGLGSRPALPERLEYRDQFLQ